MSSGSKPATTTGMRWRSTNFSKIPQPVIVAACPAARNPSTRVCGICATSSIAGGTYLCADRIEKFLGRSCCKTIAAVATAVVSKPVAKKTTSSPLARARATASATL